MIQESVPLHALVPSRSIVSSLAADITLLTIHCVGTRPMLQDVAPEDEDGEPLIPREPNKGYKPIPLIAVCERKLYRGPEGVLGFPADVLLACLVAAGKHVSIRKGLSLSTSKESLVPGCVRIRESFIAFPEGQTWSPDKRSGKPGKTLRRARFDSWSFSCSLELRLGSVDGLTRNHILDLVRRAGEREGVGAFRYSERQPSPPGQSWKPPVFGSFKLEKFE